MKRIIYNINEIFATIQCEGMMSGVPSIFVRMQGCPVGCPFCDTKHTWKTDKNKIRKAEQILQKVTEDETFFQMQAYTLPISSSKINHVVITGGEPCIKDLRPLLAALHEQGYSTQVETSGTYQINVPRETFVTLSPKHFMDGHLLVREDSYQRADELKCIVRTEEDIERAMIDRNETSDECLCYLQPVSQDEEATKLCIQAALEHQFNLSIQTHKYINVR